MPASFKPVYLIHGDDHGRIAERRARLRALAEEHSGASGFELFEGDASTPDAVAAALGTMTFAIGRRFLIADGVERWKERELAGLVAALAEMPPDTTLALFAREDARRKVPKALHDAVRRAGGDIAAEESVKPWELPKWAQARAGELGLDLRPDAARMLVAHVGERQQRLLRELEKLALDLIEPGTPAGSRTTVDSEEIEALTAASAERKAWGLADALLGGEPAAAVRAFIEIRGQGERTGGLIWWMGSRLRQALAVAQALESGQAPGQIRKTLRMPARAAEALVADAERLGVDRLRAAIGEIADLELASRGGGGGALHEDTASLLTIQRITA